MYRVIGLKQTRGIKNVTLTTAKKFKGVVDYLGSISAAFSSLVDIPPWEEFGGRSAGSFPEQRLVLSFWSTGKSGT